MDLVAGLELLAAQPEPATILRGGLEEGQEQTQKPVDGPGQSLRLAAFVASITDGPRISERRACAVDLRHRAESVRHAPQGLLACFHMSQPDGFHRLRLTSPGIQTSEISFRFSLLDQSLEERINAYSVQLFVSQFAVLTGGGITV